MYANCSEMQRPYLIVGNEEQNWVNEKKAKEKKNFLLSEGFKAIKTAMK